MFKTVSLHFSPCNFIFVGGHLLPVSTQLPIPEQVLPFSSTQLMRAGENLLCHLRTLKL